MRARTHTRTQTVGNVTQVNTLTVRLNRININIIFNFSLDNIFKLMQRRNFE